MSRFKDEWNERYYNAYEEARSSGASDFDASDYAAARADGLVNEYLEAADMLRKKEKGE